MKRRNKIIICIIAILLFVAGSISAVAAIIARLSVRGDIEFTTTTLDAEATYTSSTSNFNLSYSSAGDSKYVTATVTNNTTTDSLHVFHEISLQSGGSNTLLAAILVYYNNEYVGTLSSIISNQTPLTSETSLIAPGKSLSDRITFELHNSAPSGLFDGKSCNITLTTYTENMDYEKYILVTNESEFSAAITDINSGYLDVAPTIVLGNTITLTNPITIENRTTIATNGYSLTGSITINDTTSTSPDALLEILGSGSVSSVTLGANYDVSGAKNLVKEYALKKAEKGVVSSTPLNIIGPYGFYNLSVTTDGLTSYESPNLTGSVNYNTVSKLTLGGDTVAEVKVLGSVGSLAASNLSHMPTTNEIISKDIFLPTSIPNENASISWQSSNEAVMSNEGRIVANGEVDETITLTATIKVNSTVLTRVFTFKVSIHINEINFQKLVQEMSPLIINLVDDGTEATKYYLPNVGSYDYVNDKFESDYDYRKSFDTPSTNPTITWNAYRNIGLTDITYSMTQAQSDEYSYITIDSTTNNKIYLNSNTLSNYAKVTVTGTFENGEVYSSILNISIALGSDTQLLEKAFNSVDSALGDISILGNILSTRAANGIIGEKGDFILPSKYGEAYTITYTCDSNIISSIDAVVEAGETTGYKFIVNPEEFNSTETSIPIYVTVTYHRTEGNINKSKAIYIDAPAAIHKEDCGSISIFNTLKYQTFTSIGQTSNNGFSVSGSLITDNGYDYLLIRDIVGDATYLSDYLVDDLYLETNNITSANYQTGVNTIKLYTASSNNTSTTDTAAYDFVKLIQWATCDTKVSASSVISAASQTALGALANNKSNGETYLTKNEIQVLEAFYKHYTLDDGTLWDSLKATAMETAPGRIYDNADLLITVLKCLTDEKSTTTGWYENNTNGAYGKIYAKYLEIINRYAITTSENEEPMSPAQEVYNSKFYYSFTRTAQNSTAANATTVVSFPCKYYDETGTLVDGYCNRFSEDQWNNQSSGHYQGTYAAANKRGIAAVDLYANATGHPYDSDKTKYITSAELMVLKAFWLGALGTKTAQASTNVRKEFNSTSLNAISSVLAADPENGIYPYPEYSISDFTYYGQAILNAFDACLVIPTYLSSNGINLLISSFYENYNTDGYSLKEYGSSTNSPFTSLSVTDDPEVNGVPAVTNLDNLEGGLSFFKNLTTLDIKGNSSLYAFVGEYGLNQAFARVSLTNSNITSLTMQYVSPNWNTFDLTNIKNLSSLTTIDVSNNLGIKTLNPLLNINRGNYTSVNVANIGEVYEYNAFAIDNLASSACPVTYTNAGGGTSVKNTGNPSLLVNLSNIGDLVSEHLYLTNVIYNDDGTTTDVCWRVEQGNEIHGTEINQGGELVELKSIREMNLRVSPYYYCNEDFTYSNFNYTFKKHGLYKIVINTNNEAIITPINLDSNNNLLYTINLVNEVPSTDYENIDDSDNNLTIHEPHLTFSGEYSRTQTATSTTGNIYDQDTRIESDTTDYTLRFRYHIFGFVATDNNSTTANDNGQNVSKNYYLKATGVEITYSENQTTNDNFFVLLNQNQADFVVELRNNTFRNTTDVIMSKYGITPYGTTITLGANLPTTNSTISGYYIYSISTQKFITVYGLSDEPISKFNITRSSQNLNGASPKSTVYDLFNVDNQKYLSQTKISTNETSTTNKSSIGVIYRSSKENGNLAGACGKYSRFRAYWLNSNTNFNEDYYTLGNTITSAEKTPTLDVTMGYDKTATAYFNCVYMANGSTSAGATNYRMYDTGAFLLISNSSSVYGENAKFCFLTQEEKDRLEEWYENPQEDITLGSTPVNHQYYYIYCPYTRRFITGGATDKNGEIYKTTSQFNLADLYYTYQSGFSSGGYYIVHNSLVSSLSGRNATNTSTGIPGFNAYGGVGSAYYIALYHGDANSTCVFVPIESAYEISYSIKSSSATYIAYKVDYTVARVRAHILERDISKEYKFDNFYYLQEDLVIDGITYKAGNVIRFVCDAYYGTQYEVDLEYYELTLTYYDDRYKTNDETHKHDINQFNTAEYTYYYLQNNDINNILSFSDGIITYTKLPSGVFEKYNESAKYTTHTNPSGVTIPFPETKLIYTSTSFDEVKSGLYLDNEGAQSASDSTYVEGTTYYKPEYVVATVFSDTFDQIKGNLYTDTNGTHVANNATFDKNATYYVIGYTQLNSLVLTSNVSESYTSSSNVTSTVEVPVFEYYKHGLYTDTNGTRVALNATYNSNATYYFLQENGTYTTARPRVYSSLVGDYVTLSLNETTFEYFKHNIYSNNSGTVVSVEDQYNSDITYYTDNYVVSTFKNDVLNTYRSVLYKDSNGTKLDQEETFNPNITYYTNNFVVATGITQGNFDTWKSRLYADIHGLPLDSNATYDSSMTYYKRTFEVANPTPKGNTVEGWIQTKNQITRLYSHTKLTTTDNFLTYVSDYSKVYSQEHYPIVYKYTGTGSENIYANPTITASYEPIRTGSVTQENFATMKANLYDDASGTPLPANAVFEQGKVYYVRTWTTIANIEYENVSYQYNYGYYLIRLASNALQWQEDPDGINSNTAETMDNILADANTHFHDEDYNMWYGKHYAYNGFTMQSQNEILDINGNIVHGYDKGYVYRIVVNQDNTAFIWQQVYRYYRKPGDTMVTEASTGVAQVGDTIWATSQCFGGFYTGNKFYRIVKDDFTKTLNVIQFTDVIVHNTNSGYTDIQGQKIRYINQGNYLGYAGTYELIISAVIRINNGDGTYTYTDSVRTYKIKFVGTVIW